MGGEARRPLDVGDLLFVHPSIHPIRGEGNVPVVAAPPHNATTHAATRKKRARSMVAFLCLCRGGGVWMGRVGKGRIRRGRQ